MKIYLTLFCIGLVTVARGQDLKIGLKNETRSEKITKIKLLRVLEEYDTQKWIFTDTILIANREIPHSHPILTLNTRPQSDLSLLATFIHENIHWFLVQNKEATKNAIQQLKLKFKNVPVGNKEGAKDEYSTYLHLLVNYLEYDAIRQLAGERAVEAVLNRNTFYKWIYKTVLSNKEYLEELIQNNNLKI